MRNYNLQLDKLNDILGNQPAIDLLIHQLKTDKTQIVRFIGGNEGVNFGYRKDLVDLLIYICLQAGISKVYLRVETEEYNWEVGLKYYDDITRAGLRVDFVDFGNENYYSVKPPNLAQALVWNVFPSLRKQAATTEANKYADAFLAFNEYCKKKNRLEITNKLVWQTNYEADAINGTWHNVLKSRLVKLGFKKAGIHIYGDLVPENLQLAFTKISELLQKNFNGLIITAGEVHGLGFHKLKEEEKPALRNTNLHRVMESYLQALLLKHNIQSVCHHTLFDWFREPDNRPNYYAHYWISKEGKIINEITY